MYIILVVQSCPLPPLPGWLAWLYTGKLNLLFMTAFAVTLQAHVSTLLCKLRIQGKKHVLTLEIHGVCGSLRDVIQQVALELLKQFCVLQYLLLPYQYISLVSFQKKGCYYQVCTVLVPPNQSFESQKYVKPHWMLSVTNLKVHLSFFKPFYLEPRECIDQADQLSQEFYEVSIRKCLFLSL